MGVLFAFFSAVGYAFSTIISKVSVNKSRSPVAVGAIFQLMGAIASLLFFLFDPPRVLNSTFQTWTLFILSCLGYTVYTIFGFKANKLLEMSVSTIFGQISLVFTFLPPLSCSGKI